MTKVLFGLTTKVWGISDPETFGSWLEWDSGRISTS